jgi:hypothetical protein
MKFAARVLGSIQEGFIYLFQRLLIKKYVHSQLNALM